MPDAAEVAQCARAMREFLTRPDLLGPDADATIREMDELLARSDAGEDVTEPLLATIARHEATSDWAEHFMAPAPLMRGYSGTPGMPGPTPARSRYVCPKCGRVWVRRQAGEDVPDCPIHFIARVLVA